MPLAAIRRKRESGFPWARLDDCCQRGNNKHSQDGDQDDPDESACHESPHVGLGHSPRLWWPSLAIVRGGVQARIKKALTSSFHRSRTTPGWGGDHDAVETASAALGLSRVGPSERPAAKRRTQRALGQSSKPSQDARDLNQSFFRMATSRLTYS